MQTDHMSTQEYHLEDTYFYHSHLMKEWNAKGRKEGNYRQLTELQDKICKHLEGVRISIELYTGYLIKRGLSPTSLEPIEN